MEPKPPDIAEFRASGHHTIDLLADLLESVEEKPLFPAVEPKFLRELFDEPMPEGPTPLAEVVKTLEEKLLPYCTHVNHPGYFGLITRSPAPAGILGDLIAAGLNQNIGA